MQRVLTVHEATVQTVQVEIKVLKVGKKQVTMGLFRQLPLKELVDPRTLKLAGVPWGYVHYWWDGDGVEMHTGKRLHVVWQEGNELHRSPCYEHPPQWVINWFQKQQLPVMRKTFLLLLKTLNTISDVQIPHRNSATFDHTRSMTIAGHTLLLDFTLDEVKQLQRYCHWRDNADESSAYAKAQQAGAQDYFQQMLKDENLEDAVLSEVVGSLDALRQREHDYTQKWAKQWQTLTQLPQLFIAV